MNEANNNKNLHIFSSLAAVVFLLCHAGILFCFKRQICKELKGKTLIVNGKAQLKYEFHYFATHIEMSDNIKYFNTEIFVYIC